MLSLTNFLLPASFQKPNSECNDRFKFFIIHSYIKSQKIFSRNIWNAYVGTLNISIIVFGGILIGYEKVKDFFLQKKLTTKVNIENQENNQNKANVSSLYNKSLLSYFDIVVITIIMLLIIWFLNYPTTLQSDHDFNAYETALRSEIALQIFMSIVGPIYIWAKNKDLRRFIWNEFFN